MELCSITSLPKLGNAPLVYNYRPISIHSHISKLFELILLKKIQPSVNRVLMEEHLVFRSGRSTITCIIQYFVIIYSIRSKVSLHVQFYLCKLRITQVWFHTFKFFHNHLFLSFSFITVWLFSDISY